MSKIKDRKGMDLTEAKDIKEVARITKRKEMAAHSRTLAWKISWMEEPGRLQSIGLQSQKRLSNFTLGKKKAAQKVEPRALEKYLQGTGLLGDRYPPKFQNPSGPETSYDCYFSSFRMGDSYSVCLTIVCFTGRRPVTCLITSWGFKLRSTVLKETHVRSHIYT